MDEQRSRGIKSAQQEWLALPLPDPDYRFKTRFPIEFQGVPEQLKPHWEQLHELLWHETTAQEVARAIDITPGQARIRLYRLQNAHLIMPARVPQDALPGWADSEVPAVGVVSQSCRAEQLQRQTLGLLKRLLRAARAIQPEPA